MTESASVLPDDALEAWLRELDASELPVKLKAAERVTSVIQALPPRHHVRVMRALMQALSFRDSELLAHVVPALSHVLRALVEHQQTSHVPTIGTGTRIVIGPKMADRLEAAKSAPFTEYNEPVDSAAALVDELLDKLVYEFKYTTNYAHLKIYMRHVPVMLDTAGPHLIKHLKPLLQHVLYALSSADHELTAALLHALDILVRHCWTRMDYHVPELAEALLALYIEHWGSESALLRPIEQLLLALKACVSAARYQEILTAVHSCEELQTLYSRLK